MVVVRAPVLVARPVGVTAARFARDDVQVTLEVTSLVVPSPKSARAVNCGKAPGLKSLTAGDSTKAMELAALTDKVAVPTCPPNSAVMIAVPGATPVARPALMVATDGGVDVH